MPKQFSTTACQSPGPPTEIWLRAGKRINVKITEQEFAELSGLNPAEYQQAIKTIRGDARGTVEHMTGLVNSLSEILINCLKAGNKILVCGNGGSAAQASHFAAELISRFETDRKSLACICLNTDNSILTAIGNDYGFEHVFARQVQGLGKPGDVLLLITTSGNSNNLILAEAAARAAGITTVALSGRDGGLLRAEHSLIAEGKTTAYVQERHLSVLHEVCRLMDEVFTVLPA